MADGGGRCGECEEGSLEGAVGVGVTRQEIAALPSHQPGVPAHQFGERRWIGSVGESGEQHDVRVGGAFGVPHEGEQFGATHGGTLRFACMSPPEGK